MPVIIVPKTFKINLIDKVGNEKSVTLSPKEEYKFTMSDGTVRYATIKTVKDKDGKTEIQLAYELNPGYWDVINKCEDILSSDDISDVERIYSSYDFVKRRFRDMQSDNEVFTFAFDTQKYEKNYRISVYAGEFIGLAVNDPFKEGSTKTMYGTIVDVDPNNNTIIFARYLSNRGIRDMRPEYKVAIDSLLGIYRYELSMLGIYRYELSISDTKPTRKNWKKSESDAASTEEIAQDTTSAEETCVNCTIPDPEESVNSTAVETAE